MAHDPHAQAAETTPDNAKAGSALVQKAINDPDSTKPLPAWLGAVARFNEFVQQKSPEWIAKNGPADESQSICSVWLKMEKGNGELLLTTGGNSRGFAVTSSDTVESLYNQLVSRFWAVYSQLKQIEKADKAAQ